MKRRTKAIALMATIALMTQLGPVAAEDSQSLSLDQVVQKSRSNDLQRQIDDMDTYLKKLSSAYIPSATTGLGAGPWAVTFQMSIAPLLTDAQQKSSDYQTFNDKMNSELGYYQNAYNYWLASQNAQYEMQNLSQAQNELAITKKKFDQGIASNNDVLQAQIAVNNANAEFQSASLAKQLSLFTVNQAMNQDMNQAINIDNINVEYLPDNELNVDATLSNIYQTHKSLEPLNALMNAYQTAHDLAAKQTDVRVPVDGLVSFYNQEIQDTQLKLKQQRQRLEMMTRASIAQLQTLKANIVLDQENIDKMKQVYDNATKLYEVGMSTYSDLENTRLKLLQLNLKLASDQKDYLITAKKFELFKQGAFLVSQNNSSSGSSTGSSSSN